MSATACEIVLPAGTTTVEFSSIPKLIALALHPDRSVAETDRAMYDSVRDDAEKKHTAMLRKARAEGRVVPFSPHTGKPKSLHEWGGVVAVEVLREYAADFHIGVQIAQQIEVNSANVELTDAKERADDAESQQRKRIEAISCTRGTKRSILESWPLILKTYGPEADAAQVARILAQRRDPSEKKPERKTIHNRLGELRKEGLIP